MRSFPLARTATATAAAAGATLLGASLGGIAQVDAELSAAVAPAPAVQQPVTSQVAWHAGRRDVRTVAGGGWSTDARGGTDTARAADVAPAADPVRDPCPGEASRSTRES